MQRRQTPRRRSARLSGRAIVLLGLTVGVAGGLAVPAAGQSQGPPPVVIAPDSAPSIRVVASDARSKTGQTEPPRFPDKRVPDVRDLPKQPNQKDGSPKAAGPAANQPPAAAQEPNRR